MIIDFVKNHTDIEEELETQVLAELLELYKAQGFGEVFQFQYQDFSRKEQISWSDLSGWFLSIRLLKGNERMANSSTYSEDTGLFKVPITKAFRAAIKKHHKQKQ